MQFREMQEFKNLYASLAVFNGDKNASSYYHYRDGKINAKSLLKAIIQKWIEENEIEANIRLDGIKYNRAYEGFYGVPYTCITVEYIQIYNGKGSLDKKSRWLNKVTIHTYWHRRRLCVDITNAVARTDANFLEPTPSKFQDFIHNLFDSLVIRE